MPQVKAIILSIFDGLFTSDIKGISANTTDQIFITDTDISSGRTIMIEEDTYSIWVYLLSQDRESVDLEGFLCSVVDPQTIKVNTQKVINDKSVFLLTNDLVNKHSYIKKLGKKDITIQWHTNKVIILVKNTPYLIMDIHTKTCYSKALARDCKYGKKFEKFSKA